MLRCAPFDFFAGLWGCEGLSLTPMGGIVTMFCLSERRTVFGSAFLGLVAEVARTSDRCWPPVGVGSELLPIRLRALSEFSFFGSPGIGARIRNSWEKQPNG